VNVSGAEMKSASPSSATLAVGRASAPPMSGEARTIASDGAPAPMKMRPVHRRTNTWRAASSPRARYWAAMRAVADWITCAESCSRMRMPKSAVRIA
jgi:hypothetical protein